VTSTWRYWAAVVPSFLAVGAIALRAEWTLGGGREVRLELRAFDPMDALSGRYLGVPLAIERIERSDVDGSVGAHAPGDTVWVRLEPDEPFWRQAGISAEPPAEPDAVALRGTVVNAFASETWLDYGLGRYFIPHDAADPSVPRSAHVLTAVVRVGSDGSAVLADLLVDGERFADCNARQTR
jgi:uncharacterized membrane-anchored protein